MLCFILAGGAALADGGIGCLLGADRSGKAEKRDTHDETTEDLPVLGKVSVFPVVILHHETPIVFLRFDVRTWPDFVEENDLPISIAWQVMELLAIRVFPSSSMKGGWPITQRTLPNVVSDPRKENASPNLFKRLTSLRAHNPLDCQNPSQPNLWVSPQTSHLRPSSPYR